MLLRKPDLFTRVSLFKKNRKKMAITVKNINWSQTKSEVFVNVQIKATKYSDDVVIAEKFLKINSRPYFYELFFERPICAEESSCKILESNIKFYLKKATNELWTSLEAVLLSKQKKEIFYEYENKKKINFDNCRKERLSLKRNEIDKEIERENLIRKKIYETETDLKFRQLVKVSNLLMNFNFSNRLNEEEN